MGREVEEGRQVEGKLSIVGQFMQTNLRQVKT